MSKPVYLLAMVKGFKEAYYQQSQEERDAFWAKVEEIDRQAGAKWVIACNARWANEGLVGWGVLEYPDMEAYQKKAAALEKLEFWRFYETESILGIKNEG